MNEENNDFPRLGLNENQEEVDATDYGLTFLLEPSSSGELFNNNSENQQCQNNVDLPRPNTPHTQPINENDIVVNLAQTRLKE